MKTKIPDHIHSMDDVIKFLGELHANGESYHPEDPAADIIDQKGNRLFTPNEALRLDLAMRWVYQLCDAQKKDPCQILLSLEAPHRGKEYVSATAIEWSGNTFKKGSPFVFMKVHSDGRWIMRPVEAAANELFSKIIVDKSNFQI